MNIGLSTVGITLDIIGVAFIGLPLIFATRAKIADQSSSAFGGSSAGQARSVCEQRTDNLAGFFYLFAGFSLQWLASVNVSISNHWAWLLMLTAGVILLLVLGVRKTLINRCENAVQAEKERRRKQANAERELQKQRHQ